jgi:hypothetical protein
MAKCLSCPNAVKTTFEGESKESVVRCALYGQDSVSGSTVVRDVMHGEEWMCPLDKGKAFHAEQIAAAFRATKTEVP